MGKNNNKNEWINDCEYTKNYIQDKCNQLIKWRHSYINWLIYLCIISNNLSLYFLFFFSTNFLFQLLSSILNKMSEAEWMCCWVWKCRWHIQLLEELFHCSSRLLYSITQRDRSGLKSRGNLEDGMHVKSIYNKSYLNYCLISKQCVFLKCQTFDKQSENMNNVKWVIWVTLKTRPSVGTCTK